MSNEFQKTLQKFSEHLVSKMGEAKAMSYLNNFVQIKTTDKLKNLIETMILYTCQEYGLSKETLLNSSKMIAFYARITCYHILKKHLRIPIFRLAEYFQKKRGDAITEGLEKAQSLLEVPQYNREFVDKYKTLEEQYVNYSSKLENE